jgi:hypothetical protein
METRLLGTLSQSTYMGKCIFDVGLVEVEQSGLPTVLVLASNKYKNTIDVTNIINTQEE